MTVLQVAKTAAGSVGADPYTNPASLEFGFRRRRFQAVQELIQASLDELGHCDILDLGGTETYWLVGREFIASNRARLSITFVNTDPQAISRDGWFGLVLASATAPDLLLGRKFDFVMSNSLIEHLGTWREMRCFAANVRRLADSYYVQTPNYWFPFEPHFRLPGFQYLPARLRTRLIMRFPLGFIARMPERREAERTIAEHQLLSTSQMRELFPDAAIKHEKFLGLNKSIIAIHRGKTAGNPDS